MKEPVDPLSSPRRFRPVMSTWIVGSVVALALLGGAVSGGLARILVFAAIAALLTGLYVVITGRRSWALIPGRKAAAVVLVASLVAFTGGGVMLLNTPDFDQAGAQAPDITQATAEPPVAANKTTKVAAGGSSATHTTALALLATLPIKGKAAKTGYDRSGMFGAAWLDIDRNGCDTRNDVLARDLTSTVKSGLCTVMSGTLISPFTGTPISFLRGADTSALVQIDHVVSLSNAWQTGAQQLTAAQRISFANDPMNLLAVDGISNARKGDGDTATWLPSNKTFRCPYVARQVSVKATYGLWVTPAEHDAMARVLETCVSEPALTSPLTPAPVVVALPPPPAPATPATSVYYDNCTAARVAGAAPLYVGQPGYETPRLDRDGDGVACE